MRRVTGLGGVDNFDEVLAALKAEGVEPPKDR